LDREDKLSAFLALSETVKYWKAESGRLVKVQIIPEALAQHPGHRAEQIQCQHRPASVGKALTQRR